MPRVELKPSEDASLLMLSLQVDDGDTADAAISSESIREQFLACEQSDYLYDSASVEHLIEQYKKQRDKTAPVSGAIAKRLDASLDIQISNDNLQASVKVINAWGGKHLGANQIIIAARQANVKIDLNMKAIAGLASEARKAEPGAELTAVIAEGEPPVDGEDARYEALAQTLKERVLAPQKREDGSVDMRELGAITTVKSGDELMRRHPEAPGKDGIAVTGDPIKAKDGKRLPFSPGEGSMLSEEDPNLLVAAKEGIPRRTDNGMAVDDILELEKVDLSTGNINFEGCVLVKKDVAEEMKVTAGGDISVMGIVESATIEAGGDVIVGEGIIGHQKDEADLEHTEHSARVTAKGDIHAKYAQNADLNSQQSVTIEKYLFHSRVTADKQIWVGSENEANGRLMGGSLKAGESIQAGLIGTPSGARMNLDLSAKMDSVDRDLKQFKEKLKEQMDTFGKMEKLMRQMDPKNPSQQEYYQKTKRMLDQIRQMISVTQAEISHKKEGREEFASDVSIVARKNLYSHVRISLGPHHITSSREHGPVKVIFEDGELKIEPLLQAASA